MKKLKRILPKRAGRGSAGHLAVRHQGGRHKRFLRIIDFARDKRGIVGRVESLEYDPNRNAQLARLLYEDGERRYILAPVGLSIADKVEAGENVAVRAGNALPLSKIPVGTAVHNIQLRPGKGGQIVRSGAGSAMIQRREDKMVLVKLPSGEIRRFVAQAYATVGQVSGGARQKLGKAGVKRHMGVRPTVRGTAMHPGAHPHGGGEGRSGEGMPPKTPWGKPARGVKTRRRHKHSDSLIVERRRVGYGSPR